jgi:hypothetical protein
MVTLEKHIADIKIKLGSYEVETPYVVSVSVTRSRGNPVSSAAVQFIYKGNVAAITNNSKKLQILVLDMNQTYFVGTVKKITVAPSFRVGQEYVIRIQAEDAMYKIVNKRFTRRQKSAGIGPVAIITNLYKRPDLGFDDPTQRHNIEREGSIIEAIVNDFNVANMTQFLKSGQDNTLGDLHPITKVADKLTSPSTGGTGGGFILHQHASMSLDSMGGGPALSVFGVR